MKFRKKKSLLIGFGILSLIAMLIILICNILLWKEEKNYKANYAAVGILAFIGIVNILLGLFSEKNHKKIITTKMMSLVGVMGAISSILYIFVKFNLGIFPSFLDIQISEIPALIAGFAYGPVAGSLVIIIRCIIKLPLTSTSFVGEFADLITGLALVIPASLIYKKHKTFKGAIGGFCISATFSIVVALIANWLILIPFYIQFFFDGSLDPLLGMCAMIPNINASNYMSLYIFVGCLPFNILRYILVGIFTFILYKGTHKLLNNITA